MIKRKKGILVILLILSNVLGMSAESGNSGVWSKMGDLSIKGDLERLDLAVHLDGTTFLAARKKTPLGDNVYSYTLQMYRYLENSDFWDTKEYGDELNSDGSHLALEIDAQGTVFIAFNDTSQEGRLTVKKFNYYEGLWEDVGAEGFSDAPLIAKPQLKITHDGICYSAYTGGDNGEIVFVKKFVNGEWVSEGDLSGLGYTGGQVMDFAVSRSGTPYIAVVETFFSEDYGHDISRSVVKKYDGIQWVSLGEGMDSAVYRSNGTAYQSIWDLSLAISSNDNVYVAYTHWLSYWSTFVVKFNGSYWEDMGDVVSSVYIDDKYQLIYRQCPPSLEVTSQEQLYVTMVGQKKDSEIQAPSMFVMTYDTVNQGSWTQAGNAGGLDDRRYGLEAAELELDMFGNPYIVYKGFLSEHIVKKLQAEQ